MTPPDFPSWLALSHPDAAIRERAIRRDERRFIAAELRAQSGDLLWCVNRLKDFPNDEAASEGIRRVARRLAVLLATIDLAEEAA